MKHDKFNSEIEDEVRMAFRLCFLFVCLTFFSTVLSVFPNLRTAA